MYSGQESDPIVAEGLEPAAAPPTEVGGPPGGAPSSGRRRFWLLFFAAVVAFGLLGSYFFRLPYYTLSPGSIRPTANAILSEEAPLIVPDHGVSYATVSVRGPVNIWELGVAWLDSEVEVVDEDLVTQGRSNEETKQANLVMMDQSKDVALKVALSQLGRSREAGAQIIELVRDSPAATGFLPGDVVIAVDGAEVKTSTDLVEAITARKPGDRVDFDVLRQPEGRDEVPEPDHVEVVLAEDPRGERPGVAFFGVRVRSWVQVDYPYEIHIDSGSVGGPSAGLAFTLGVIDMLTEGELAGSGSVAATGTIDMGGHVGPIGALDHKVDAARHAGIDLFLVPASQSEEELTLARERAKGEVEIVPVDDVEEALAVLAGHGGGLGDGRELAAPSGR